MVTIEYPICLNIIGKKNIHEAEKKVGIAEVKPKISVFLEGNTIKTYFANIKPLRYKNNEMRTKHSVFHSKCEG